MTIALPPALAGYFAADRTDDPFALLRMFAEDAVVIDERRTHIGREAIRVWKAEAAARYSYTAEPFAAAEQGGRIVVTARLTGNFPGSPAELRYTFTLDAGLITRLEIAS